MIAVEPRWWASAFGMSYLATVGEACSPEQTAAEVDALLAAVALASPATILDLGCGQGRHAIELASRGYAVTGIDVSHDLLEVARERAAERGAQVSFVRADYSAEPVGGPYDLAISCFTAFGQLESDADDALLLRKVHAALAPGGQFAIETINRDGVATLFPHQSWQETDDGTLAYETREFDPQTGRLLVDQRFRFADGRDDEQYGMSVRLYPTETLAALLRGAGFGEIELYEGFVAAVRERRRLDRYVPRVRRIFVRARKEA